MEFLSFKFLHIVSMFAAVSLLAGPSAIYFSAFRRRDAVFIGTFGRLIGPIENIGVVALLAGIAFGLGAGWTGQFDLLAPWLVIAYVLTGAAAVVGMTESALAKRAVEAAQAVVESGDRAAFEGALADRRLPMLSLASVGLYVALIFDMVVKPFS